MSEILLKLYGKINNIFIDGTIEACIGFIIAAVLFFAIYKTIKYILKKNDIDNTIGLLSIIKFLFFLIFGIIVCSQLKIFKGIGDTLMASGGIIAVVLGIAAQDTFGNLFSGLMIITTKPFRVGDLIKINGEQLIGFVEEINLRHTIIKTYESNRVTIPNSVLNQATIENANLIDSTKGNYLKISISYESDIDLAIKIIKEECYNHENFLDTRTQEEIEKGVEPVTVRIVDFAENGVVLRTIVSSKDSFHGFEMLSDLRYSIKKRFDKEGINIPYPHTTVVFKEEGIVNILKNYCNSKKKNIQK